MLFGPGGPDYAALLGQQGQINQNVFNQQLGAGRINQTNPYGYSQWTPPPGFYAGNFLNPPPDINAPDPLSGTNPGASAGTAPQPYPGYPQQHIGVGRRHIPGSPPEPHAPPSSNAPNVPPGPGYNSQGLWVGTAPTAPWSQQTGFLGPMQDIVSRAQANSSAALGAFNPANNPTWQGPSAQQAYGQSWQGPTAANAAALQYNGPNSNTASSMQWQGPNASQASGLQWQGPQAGQVAGVGYGGPSSAGNLQFNPAGVAQNLYQSQMGLLEPGMQQQAAALDNNLKAMGYDTTSAGGAQNAENNLQNQQNLLRAQTANWAVGQAIPQGAQALYAQESVPQVQQQIAQGYQQGQLNPMMAAANVAQAQGGLGLGALQTGGSLASQQYQNQLSGLMGAGQLAQQQFGAGEQQLGLGGSLAAQQLAGNLGALQTGAGIAGQQFGAGVSGQQLLGGEASGFLNNAITPNQLLPGGSAQVASLNPVDALGTAQTMYANQMSAYNAQQALDQSQTNGLMGLIGSGMMAYALSDRRLKTNIKRLHTVRPGLNLYSFSYRTSPNRTHLGYMSDEVRRYKPEAVTVNKRGFDVVNYAMLPHVGAA